MGTSVVSQIMVFGIYGSDRMYDSQNSFLSCPQNMNGCMSCGFKLFTQGSHQVSVIGEDIFFLEFSLIEDFFCGAFIVLLGSFSCYEFVMH